MTIRDVRDCPTSGLFYGGRAGRKEGLLVNGEPWIAKYPRTTRDLVGKNLPSYTSSPISEYLGSHIFELAGIPVQQTELGYRNGKVVCLCKDFTYPDLRLFEFKELKNSLSDDDEGFSSAPSDGESVYLGDVLAAIETVPVLRDVVGVRERFWDMFVIDAFLKNPDRNNGNWGLLMDADMTYSLAPVYGLGSSLFSKRSDSVTAARLDDPIDIEQDAFGTNVSCYKLAMPDGASEVIHPFEYMRKTDNPDLRAAIARFAQAIDMDAVDGLIDSVPEEAYGIVLMTDVVRESHKRLLHHRFEEGILPLI